MELVTENLPPVETLQTTPTLSVEALMAQVEELKAKLASATPVAATPPPEAAPAVPMTVEEAKALMATFAGKRGRRPAIFREAEAIVEASLTAEDKAAAKAQAKADAKAAREAKKAAKAAKKAARVLATLNAKVAAAKAASDKIAKVFLKASGKYEALVAQVEALTPKAPAAE